MIFITAITQSSSPRHKKEIQAVFFVCLYLLLPRDKELLLCEGGQKSAEVPAVDLRVARVQGHFRPKSFRLLPCVWFIRFSRSRLTIFPSCGFQSGWLQLLHESRKALAYLVHPLVLISFSNCGSSWNIYLYIQVFLDQNLCSISHVKLYWDIWTRHHRSCWRQNNSD